MPRIRTIKPEFWTDGAMVQLSPWARLLYIGTWNFALCDRGHLDDDPMSLKLRILPADDVDVAALVEELIAAGRLIRHRAADGRSYLHNPRLAEHQKIDARWTPRCPYCAQETPPNHAEPPSNSPNPIQTPKRSPQGSKGKEGKGKESTTTTSSSDARETRAGPTDPKGTRLPDDFQPTQNMIDWARDKAPTCTNADHEAFTDYWRGVPGTRGRKLDWPATWRNWMRTEHQKRASPNGHARASPNRESTTDARMRQATAAGERVQTQLDQARHLEITDGRP